MMIQYITCRRSFVPDEFVDGPSSKRHLSSCTGANIASSKGGGRVCGVIIRNIRAIN